MHSQACATNSSNFTSRLGAASIKASTYFSASGALLPTSESYNTVLHTWSDLFRLHSYAPVRTRSAVSRCNSQLKNVVLLGLQVSDISADFHKFSKYQSAGIQVHLLAIRNIQNTLNIAVRSLTPLKSRNCALYIDFVIF